MFNYVFYPSKETYLARHRIIGSTLLYTLLGQEGYLHEVIKYKGIKLVGDHAYGYNLRLKHVDMQDPSLWQNITNYEIALFAQAGYDKLVQHFAPCITKEGVQPIYFAIDTCSQETIDIVSKYSHNVNYKKLEEICLK